MKSLEEIIRLNNAPGYEMHDLVGWALDVRRDLQSTIDYLERFQNTTPQKEKAWVERLSNILQGLADSYALMWALVDWANEIREDLREKISYSENFLNHLPAKEWELFKRLDKIIPDPKASKG